MADATAAAMRSIVAAEQPTRVAALSRSHEPVRNRRFRPAARRRAQRRAPACGGGARVATSSFGEQGGRRARAEAGRAGGGIAVRRGQVDHRARRRLRESGNAATDHPHLCASRFLKAQPLFGSCRQRDPIPTGRERFGHPGEAGNTRMLWRRRIDRQRLPFQENGPTQALLLRVACLQILDQHPLIRVRVHLAPQDERA
jgi:hypothetical protein